MTDSSFWQWLSFRTLTSFLVFQMVKLHIFLIWWGTPSTKCTAIFNCPLIYYLILEQEILKNQWISFLRKAQNISSFDKLKIDVYQHREIWQDTKVYVHSIQSTYSIMNCHAHHKQSLSEFLSALNLGKGPFYSFCFLSPVLTHHQIYSWSFTYQFSKHTIEEKTPSEYFLFVYKSNTILSWLAQSYFWL